tara:strand:+ start:69918 stop:70994 length:1077 start_codon:yes stop_codon:yes gene_type:complete
MKKNNMIDRREFAKILTSATMLLSVPSCQKASHEKFLLGWSNHLYTFNPNDSFVNIFGLNIGSIELGSIPHDFLELPDKKIITIPKWGKIIDVIDNVNLTKIKEIKCRGNEEFMGHGVVINSQNKLFISAIRMATGEYGIDSSGIIKVYDLEKLKLIEEFSTHGSQPHELAVINNKLFVLNPSLDQNRQATGANIAIFDISKNKLIEIKEFDDKSLLFSHLDKLNDKEIVFINERAEGDDDNKIKPCFYDEEKGFYFGEETKEEFSSGGLLSVSHGKKIIAITAPQDNAVLFWDLKSKKYLSKIMVKNPKAISFNHLSNKFIVGCDEGIVAINEKDYKINYLYKIDFANASSSHGIYL